MGGSCTVGFVAALASEAGALGKSTPLRLHAGLRSLPDGSVLAVSGMGREAASRSACRLAEAGCAALASWGFAGALDPSLSAGTVLVPEAILAEEAPAVDATPAWRERLLGSLAAQAERIAVNGGKLFTSPHAVEAASDKQDLWRRTGAAAVDMESHAIAQVAAARGLPFLCLRVIVDGAADEVPAALIEAADARGRIVVGRLVAGLLSSPSNVVPLLRLARRYRAARASLRAVASAGVLSASRPGR